MRTSMHAARAGFQTIALLIAYSGLHSFAAAQVPPTPAGGTEKPQPKITATEKIRDLGTVVAGMKIDVAWEVKNEGSADLLLDKTTASCGCTAVSLANDQKVLPPGKSTTIKAIFDSAGRRGEQLKSVIVYSNDPIDTKLELQFKAMVSVPFEMTPPGRVNIRGVRRGQMAPDALEITPGETKQPVKNLQVTLKDGGLLQTAIESFTAPGGPGQKVRFTVSQDAPLGTLTASGTVRFETGDYTHVIDITVHGEVVGELVAQPKMLLPANQPVPIGKRLAPITIRSTEKVPFEIRGIQAGDALDVTVEPVADKPAGTEFTVYVAIGPKAQPGPLAANIEVRTNLLNQPTLSIPAFAVVAPRVMVEPSVLIFRKSDIQKSPRRVRLLAGSAEQMIVTKVESPDPAVQARIASTENTPENTRYVEVQLAGSAMPNKPGHLTISTNVPGAETLELPYLVEE